MSERNEAALFPPFEQEHQVKANAALASVAGQLMIDKTFAQTAAEVYSGRVQVLETKYRETSGRLQELETDIASLREAANKPVDLSTLDLDVLKIELNHRGYLVTLDAPVSGAVDLRKLRVEPYVDRAQALAVEPTDTDYPV